MRISVFGLGYVGSVTAACLAELGHHVVGVEPNAAKVELMNAGQSPVLETGLGDLTRRLVDAGRLRATVSCEEAVLETELAFICVGTPSNPDGDMDLRYVQQVAAELGAALARKRGYFRIVVRSTVLPGTVEDVIIPYLEEASGRRAGADFGVCMNPEFLREGSAIADFFHPPKIVIGELDARSGEALVELYRDIPAERRNVPLRVAEMVKYADNAFHAAKVAFANEIGGVCKALRIDSHQVMDLFCLDTKLNLSATYLKPGFAFGGSCLPKDLRALNYLARSRHVDTPLLSSVLVSNRQLVRFVIDRLVRYRGRRFGFFGLSFKHGTDDLRESPLVEVIEAMLGKGFAVRVFDPHVSVNRLVGTNKEFIEREIPHIARLMSDSAEDLLESADVLVLGHRGPDVERALTKADARHVVFDLVRACPERPPGAGEYIGISW